MALPTRIGKEISTGTSTAAVVEASLHGAHPVLIVVIIGGFVAAGIFHAIEQKFEEKHENNSARKSGVRDYGIIRVL